jgi:hypothetical protein
MYAWTSTGLLGNPEVSILASSFLRWYARLDVTSNRSVGCGTGWWRCWGRRLLGINGVLAWVETPVTEILEDPVERRRKNRAEAWAKPILARDEYWSKRDKEELGAYDPMALEWESGYGSRTKGTGGIHCRTRVVDGE